MSIVFKNRSTTPKPYRFSITSEESILPLVCDRDPGGWKEGVLTLKRDLKLSGVFSTFQVETLTFIGNAAVLLNLLFENREINAEATLTIARFDRDTYEYIDFPTTYDFKFATFRRVKVGGYAFGVEIDCVESSVMAKIDDRKDVELNLYKLETIGGMTLADFPQFPTASKLTIPALYTQIFGSAGISGTFPSENEESGDATYTSIPLLIGASDFPELRSVSFETLLTTKQQCNPFFENNTIERDVTIFFNVRTLIIDRDSDDPYSYRFRRMNGVTEIEDVELWKIGGEDEGTLTNESLSIVRTLSIGDTLYFYVKVESIRNIGADIKYAYVSISETVASTAEMIAEGLPLLEAFDRCSQLMLDDTYPFYSEYFGRDSVKYTDTLTYNDVPGFMENTARYTHVCSGDNLRGLPIADEGAQLKVTFDKLFKAANNIWGLGYAVEYIGGRNRLRIENFEYFYQDVELLDLSSRISVYDIETEYISELAFVQVKNGWKNQDFETANGRGEYNGEVARTLPIKATETHDMVSEINTSTIAIINAINTPITSEDTKTDENVFFIKAWRDEDNPGQWIAETDQQVTIENNSSLLADSSLNLFFAPAWCFYRNAKRLTSTLQKEPAGKVRFQSGAKWKTLETTIGGVTLKENADMYIANLPAPIFKPIKRTVTCKILNSEMNAILANPYGYITFTSEISGWIVEVSKRNAKDEATISIIEKI